jgi:2-C-methyl-D-erythritol 4-phosphate cytidylyltransferase
VVLVVGPAFMSWAKSFARRHGLKKIRAIVPGGAERGDSVRNGVMAAPADADVVMIHDAARALVTPEIVDRVARAAHRAGAALAAWPAPDTLKLSDGDAGDPRVRKTVPRRDMWLAQTPQGFRRDVKEKIFSRPRKPLTDDVQLAEAAGLPVAIVPGAPDNFKVTLPADFAMAGKLLVVK